MIKNINEIQEEIIENFSLFDGEKDLALEHLWDLGRKLPVMPEEYKKEENLIKGCESKVWLVSLYQDGHIKFVADSNNETTKGLISLLVSLWNDRTPDEILSTELYFIDKIGLSGMLTSKRSNGFASMIKQMRMYAVVYKK